MQQQQQRKWAYKWRGVSTGGGRKTMNCELATLGRLLTLLYCKLFAAQKGASESG